ncbi:hypothetical protein BC941DRAFT_240119 [Chlamydoabsidia padenii]|nr:hypothetical protein BC941DRAFT_240119 [Chlamydoabsidia padenii]
MSEKKATYENVTSSSPSRPPKRKPALPNIHPDDAKDKVFTAILKALLKKGNKPSSPKELANDIVKHKYATLGGATPFATVSSRISQHFKRAAEHNPPRAPLLVKHVDQRHSRKINYSLMTPGDSSTTSKSSSASSSSSQSLSNHQGQHPLAQHHEKPPVSPLSSSSSSSSSSPLSSPHEEEFNEKLSDMSSDEKQPYQQKNDKGGKDQVQQQQQQQQHYLRSVSHHNTGSKSTPLNTRSSSIRRRRRRSRSTRGTTTSSSPPSSSHQLSDSDHESPEPKRSRRQSSVINLPSFSTMTDNNTTPIDGNIVDDEDSEADYSDYYEEMMKGDETMAHIEISRRRSSVFRRPSIAHPGGSTGNNNNNINTNHNHPHSNNNKNNNNNVNNTSNTTTTSSSSTTTTTTTTDSPKLVGRKLSLPLNGLLGDNEFWTPYTFEQDLNNDTVFLPEHHATSHHHQQVPLNIVAPESISETELELYFGGPTLSNSNLDSARTSRKSFCTLSNGKEASLLHQALLANSVRGRLALESTGSEEDDDDEDTNENEVPMRRRSWPLTGHQQPTEDDELFVFPDRQKATATTDLESATTPTTKEEDDEQNNDKLEVKEQSQQQQETNKEPVKEDSQQKDDDADDADDDDDLPISKTYSENGHRFTITKKLFGNLQCYELDSPDDIPDTKVLRFIASNDGASEHVALRTRHADAAKQEQRRNSQYFYLVEGCINATQLRKAARPVLGKGVFDAVAEMEGGRLVVTITKGPAECRGAWVTLGRARELVDEFEIESSPGLAKLLGDNPMGDNNSERRKSSTVGSLNASSPASLVSNGTPPNTISTLSAHTSNDLAGDDEFVQFEEDDKAPDIITTTAGDKAAPVSEVAPPMADSTDSTSAQSLNLSAFQQLTASIPGFNNLTPTLDLARSFASYMQAVAKATSSNNQPGASPTSQSSPSLAFDLKSALARFPALDALLKKESSTLTPAHNTTQSMPTSPTYSSTASDTNKIYPTTPTNPPMYITVIDNVTVCVATLSVSGDNGDKTYTVMRRLDTGFVNGTSLLTAGGIDTERERSMILSFEMERIRIPNKDSELCGTWIPLRRAQELAVTCSIQNRLGPFLSDRVESFFSSTIPISRGPSGVRSGKPLARLRRTPSSGDMANKHLMSAAAASDNTSTATSSPGQQKQQPSASSTQLQQLLLSHPYKTLKLGGDTGNSTLSMLKAPLLGSFDRMGDVRQRRSIEIITSQQRLSSSGDEEETPTDSTSTTQRDLDIDILNDDSVDDDSGADTESDTDVNEVRERMKRMRDAAIDAMETGHSMEELLSRASGPIVHPMRSIQIRTQQQQQQSSSSSMATSATTNKRRRLFNIEEEGAPPPAFRKPANFLPHGRRRPPTANPNWVGGKLTASMIKKSASWNGALPLPRNNLVVPGTSSSTRKTATGGSKRKKAQRKDEATTNHVVEHHEATTTTPAQEEPTIKDLPTVPENTVMVTKSSASDEDEDEEIDIGGSDDDDDVR